jgi:hypothetical protein
MSINEVPLSSLIKKTKEKIKKIKGQGNAFVTDWELIEMIETILEKIKHLV